MDNSVGVSGNLLGSSLRVPQAASAARSILCAMPVQNVGYGCIALLWYDRADMHEYARAAGLHHKDREETAKAEKEMKKQNREQRRAEREMRRQNRERRRAERRQKREMKGKKSGKSKNFQGEALTSCHRIYCCDGANCS